MNKKDILKKTESYLKNRLKNMDVGHDWWHTYRVRKMAIKIAREEKNVDLFVVQLAALLHDIADWKFHDGDLSLGPKLAREWLEKLEVEESVISHVCEIIENISFKGARVRSRMKTREGMVVQDADRLDGIGAIGIARTFAYGGYKAREIYNPAIKPEKHDTFEKYKNNKGTSINHFYEKLLLLKNLMNTKTGKRIAEKRHKFTVLFLKQFLREWKGKE